MSTQGLALAKMHDNECMGPAYVYREGSRRYSAIMWLVCVKTCRVNNGKQRRESVILPAVNAFWNFVPGDDI
jgi:hypothetical protein